MLQVIQPINNRATEVADVPAPICPPQHVLIANICSLISAGTEKIVIDLARKSLLGKAMERPDQVRRVLQKASQEGLIGTLRQVRAKLAQPMPLGYSSAGVVIQVGSGVDEFRPGDRVASNGPHAAVVAVGKRLVAHIPDGVPFDHACYAVIGSVALQGVRLAGIGLGSVVGVIGLGLIGQLTTALVRASGGSVVGMDPNDTRCELARALGADWAAPTGFVEAVAVRTRGHGADAVVIAASTASDGPLELAARVTRAKGRVVATGATGLNVPRRAFYAKELELVVSCSYGPGRYDPSYEVTGIDYPYGHVRWTEQRNIQAVLDLLGSGRLDVGRLTTHRFPIERAAEAYDRLRADQEPTLGVVLDYPEPANPPTRRIAVRPREPGDGGPRGVRSRGVLRVGFLGAGNFATTVLLPALAVQDRVDLRIIVSAGGLSALTQARRLGFRAAGTDHREVLSDPDVDVVFIATRHNLHAALLLEALKAGKAAFVEKPLAISPEELGEVTFYLEEEGAGGPPWMVGFNRRFSAAAASARELFAGVEEPVTAVYRFNAGELPPGHWVLDLEVGGGRIVGEACHSIDLLTFLHGSPAVRVHAEATPPAASDGRGCDRCVLTLRHANGGVSTLLYTAGGDRALPKERVELIGGSRVAVIDDFRRVELYRDGRRSIRRFRGQDKGHRAEVDAFLAAVRSGGPGPIPTADLFATTRAMFAALESIRTGGPVGVES
jgi:predicted dehydrogenase